VKLFEEAGFPPGWFNVVTGYGKDVGMPLVEARARKKNCVHGSDATGPLINEVARRRSSAAD